MTTTLNKTQQAAAILLRSRLDPGHPMFAGSAEVKKALAGDARPYLDTWVLPLLDFLIDGEQWFGQAADIRVQFNVRAAAAEAARKWEASDALTLAHRAVAKEIARSE